jgi:hypothetical protein
MMRVQRSFAMTFAIIAALVVLSAAALAADDSSPAKAPADNLPSSQTDIDNTKIDRAEPGKEWWRDVVARFPNCATLTDGCQSCVPHGDGLTCANPGIACIRSDWRCSEEKPPTTTPADKK